MWVTSGREGKTPLRTRGCLGCTPSRAFEIGRCVDDHLTRQKPRLQHRFTVWSEDPKLAEPPHPLLLVNGGHFWLCDLNLDGFGEGNINFLWFTLILLQDHISKHLRWWKSFHPGKDPGGVCVISPKCLLHSHVCSLAFTPYLIHLVKN